MTDLEAFLSTSPLCDTHEHLRSEERWIHEGPDILTDIFGAYLQADLHSAGASAEALVQLNDSSNPDLLARFLGIREAWEHCRFTGYGRAAKLLATEVHGMEAFDEESLQAANKRLLAWRRPRGRLALLRERGKLDHVQVDDFTWACEPDADGFFYQDLSWLDFSSGQVDPQALYRATGCQVCDLADLDDAMSALFALYGSVAIAVKTQHAYRRALSWGERTRSEAESALQQVLAGGDVSCEARHCLGDWCLARGIELAIPLGLPVKIHVGIHAGNDRMPLAWISAAHLSPLLARYPKAIFVLMHTGYPYTDEVIALAKHYRNVFVDLCWAWAISPRHTADFVRRFLHAVPANKLFAFGGDTRWPTGALAYSIQARQGLAGALALDVGEGFMTEPEAIALAAGFLWKNQYACFPRLGDAPVYPVPPQGFGELQRDPSVRL